MNTSANDRNEQKRLYRMMQQYAFVLQETALYLLYAFVLQETALYLDTHPNCRAALSYFRKNNARLAEVTAQYEAKYGPVTYYGQDCGEHWKWVDTPWPWEYNAEGCR